MTTSILRGLLIADIVLMALLALLYLGQRRLEWRHYCFWGILALLVPILGPFLVIHNRPGRWRIPPVNVPPFSRQGLRILSGRIYANVDAGCRRLAKQYLERE